MANRRPYKRTDRLNQLLREVLATSLLSETREELLRQVIVTGVSVTRDLSVARVYYYLLGGDPDEVTKALHRASGFLRSRVGQEIRMRQSPELRFTFDTSVDYGRRVEAILSDLDLPPLEAAELSSDEGLADGDEGGFDGAEDGDVLAAEDGAEAEGPDEDPAADPAARSTT